MSQTEVTALVAASAALVSAVAAVFVALRQGRLNRQLVRLQAANIERREFRDGLLLMSATSKVVSERSRDLQVAAKANPTPAELRTKFDAFSVATEYLLQSWTAFATNVTGDAFTEIRESVAKLMESAEATRLGWLVLVSDGPASTAHAMAGYAGTAAQWSLECHHMCAVGAQASGVLVDRRALASAAR